MLKNALENSITFNTVKALSNAFEHSSVKRIMDKLSVYAGESACGKLYNRFKSKRCHIEGSLYKKTLDKISGIVSDIMAKLNPFFTRILSGSAVNAAYLRFAKSGTGEKLWFAGIFGFYFLLSTILLEIARGLLNGGGISRLEPLYIAALVFFIPAMFGRRIVRFLTPVINNSFFASILKDLLR